MKKLNIFHPKLYFKYELHNNNIKLFYQSNKLNHLGERLAEESLLDAKSFSNSQMNTMNKEQYHNLLIYIKRQEKVMATYLKKGFNDQYLIVKNGIIMSMEWIYSNLITIIIILCVAIVILFFFPVLLGKDLLRRAKK